MGSKVFADPPDRSQDVLICIVLRLNISQKRAPEGKGFWQLYDLGFRHLVGASDHSAGRLLLCPI